MGEKLKIISTKDTKLRIIGDNILYINGNIIAYYILPLNNYSVISFEGRQYFIDSLTNLLSGLASNRPGVKFSLQRFSKVIKANDVINNMYETIRLYAPDYDMPEEFTSNIQDNTQDYCLLGVSIDKDGMENVEEDSIIDVSKQLIKNFSNSILGVDSGILDEEKILVSEKNIYNTLRTQCARATKELVFYNFASKLYPSYEISYDKMSFINEDNFSNILGVLTQTMEDKFGYFILHNEGIDMFDMEPSTTYGCIIDIKKFPENIESTDFDMNYPNIQVNIQTIPKDKAVLNLKRTRSADKYEEEEAEQAGAELEQLEALNTSIAVATHAIEEFTNGVQACEFSAKILVTGLTLEELKANTQIVMSSLKDRNILVAKSLTQAMDYINSYVKLNIKSYDHFTNLMFPLSFQINNGALVGNSDDPKFFVPAIGRDI